MVGIDSRPIRGTVSLIYLLVFMMVLFSCGGGGGGGGGDDGDVDSQTTRYALTVTTSGQGSVALVPPGGTYDAGTNVLLIAVPEAGWAFDAWSGDISGSTNPVNVTMNADVNVTATFIQTVSQDTEAPSWPSGSSLSASDIGATFITLKWDAAADNVGVTIYRIYKDQVLEGTVSGTLYSYAVTGLVRDTTYEFKVEAGDAAGNWTASALATVGATAAAPPPDPQSLASTLTQTGTTSLLDASAFLYTGPDAIQKGVAPGTIKSWRVGVIKGRVVDESDQPLPDVTVSLLGRPEFGRTSTRADGAYDMAVNGGGLVKVVFEKEGHLPVKREVRLPWQSYKLIDDVVMITRDGNVTPIVLNSLVGAQSARGSIVTDDDGTRQATLVVPTGVGGELVLQDGTRHPLTTMDVRLTEFTEGEAGPRRMPAEMPPNIGYTYAMELSIDEGLDANAADVVFDSPLYYYVENFLGFPAGTSVPTGYYDEERGAWVGSTSGKVIKIIGIDAGLATIDSDGDDQPDGSAALAALGFTNDELSKLAELYVSGDSLWRVPIEHFSSWDCNFGAWPPPDAKIPWFKPDPKRRKDPCKRGGSIIDANNMALGETIPIAGLPFGIHYRSNRMPGSANTREILLRDENAPDSLAGIKLELEVAGQLHSFDFDVNDIPETYAHSFTWDGKDGYGREVQGSAVMNVGVGYVYDGVYEANDTWGEPGVAVEATEIPSRDQIALWNRWTVPIGGLGPRAQGLGGWSLEVHHFYDAAGGMLYCGCGRQVSVEDLDPVINVVAGTGMPDETGVWVADGMPATSVNLSYFMDIAAGPDGSLYIAEPGRGVLQVAIDGTIQRVAGGGHDFDSDGIPVTEAMVAPMALAVGPDESLYISEGDRIRRVSPDGLITTIAGDGDQVYGPDGGPALGADFMAYRLVLAPEGTIYFLDTEDYVVRKIGTDGRLSLYAGTPGITGAYSGDGGQARDAIFGDPYDLAIGSDGSLYVADATAARVLKIAPSGIITTVAGTGVPGISGDGGPATEATLLLPMAVTVGPDNSLYIGNAGAVRKVGPDGTIATIAGSDEAILTDDGSPATRTQLAAVTGLQLSPDGNLLLAEQGRFDIRKVGAALGISDGQGQVTILDKQNEELYTFDAAGRHLKTVDLWSKAEIWSFGYDQGGYLVSITDAAGNETMIARDGSGNPTAIEPPWAPPTTLATNADGFLERITDPEGNAYQLAYEDAEGLLTELTLPGGGVYAFAYDGGGRLVLDTNPDGDFQALARTLLDDNNGVEISVSTAMDRMTRYETRDLDDGGIQVVKTYPHGLAKSLTWSPDASQQIHYVDGTIIDFRPGPDPRFGMQLPIPELLTETTPSGKIRTLRMERSVQLGSIVDTIYINDRAYTHAFEEGSRTFHLTTPEGRQKIVSLNEQARVGSILAGTLAPIQFTYDAQGRTEAISIGNLPNKRTYQFGYDDSGFLSSATDPLGHTTGFTNDAAGRIVAKTLADGRVLSIDYDDDGRVASITPPGKPTHALEYSGAGRFTAYDPPDLAGLSPDRIERQYDEDGLLSTIINPEGIVLTVDYDAAGRAEVYTHSHGTVTVTYDGDDGQVASLNTSDGIVEAFVWDGFLRTGETWSGPFDASMEGAYNDRFLISAMRVNGGAWRSYDYDDDGLMVAAGVLDIVRDENGMVTDTVMGDVTTHSVFNAFGEKESFTAAVDGTLLFQATYRYDASGRIIQIDEGLQGEAASVYQYTYDAGGRLMAVSKNAVPMSTYTYDGNSNRLSYSGPPANAVGIYDDQDRILSYGNATYSHTSGGDLLTKTIATDTTTYVYDSVGGLRTVFLPDGTEISYLVDAMGRRIGKKRNGVLEQGFIYRDQLTILAELDGEGNVVSEFVYGTHAHVPDYMIKAGMTYRIVSDHLGSPRLVVNTATGEVVQRIDYDAFGNSEFVVGTADVQPFGFAGGLYDHDTGLVRFGARDYDPETGRWTCKDPILFSGGDTNLYGYVLADPVNLIDPTGYKHWYDYIPTSQGFVDAIGGVGDACLSFVTFGILDPGKDMRQAIGKDIVNECSETYKKARKTTDTVLQTTSAVSGVAGLRSTINGLNQAGGASKFFQDANNVLDLGGGAAGSIQTLVGN